MTTSPTPQPEANTPSAQPARDVVHAFLSALERLDYDDAIALTADDVRWINAPITTARNRRQFDRALRAMFANAETFEVQYADIHERGDGVVYTDRIDIFEGGGVSMTLPVQGEFRVRDGRIVEWVDRFRWRDVVGSIAKSLPDIIRYRLRR